jgi:UDPglucose 6-dehydrogenase
MRIGVIGAGFVGLTSACVLAERGHQVYLLDQNQDKLATISSGILPFFEEGLKEIFENVVRNKNLLISNWQDIKALDIALICVGTPSKPNGSIDLTYVEKAIEDCDKYLKDGQIIVIKSSVIPGSTRKLESQYRNNGSTLKFAMVPEFLREGSAVEDSQRPDRVVIGTQDNEVAELLSETFGVKGSPIIVTSSFSAETIKYFSNVLLATCISMSNELFDLVNRDADCIIPDILEGWHLDRRLTTTLGGDKAPITKYLVPGPGFGGSCFPKDISAINAEMQSLGVDGEIVNAVIQRNFIMPILTSSWIAEHVPIGEKILIMGISFKENTDDLRNSPAISIINELEKLGYEIEWIDNRPDTVELSLSKSRIRSIDKSTCKYVVLTNHENTYRDYLTDYKYLLGHKPVTVLAIRYQEPIQGFKWLHPRQVNI